MENNLNTYTLNELAERGIALPAVDRELWYSPEELSEALGKVLTGVSIVKYADLG